MDFASIGTNDKVRPWSSIRCTTKSTSGLRPRPGTTFGIASSVSRCEVNEGQSPPAFGRMPTDLTNVSKHGQQYYVGFLWF